MIEQGDIFAGATAVEYVPGPRTPGHDERDRVLARLRLLRAGALRLIDDYLREVARWRASGRVTSDDAHFYLDKLIADGLPYDELATADRRFFGALFRDDWEWTGQITATKLKRGHARPIKIYRLAEGAR